MATNDTEAASAPGTLRSAARLYRTSVGKKVAMAGSGIVLFVYVVGHLLGNLKVFEGPESFNSYADWLRATGAPALPEYGMIWAVRIILLVAVAIHVGAALQLWRQSRAARPQGYRFVHDISFSYASRTMRWGGVIIAAFVVYHLLHFTVGTAHPDFEYGNPYSNVVIGLQSPLVSGFYILAIAALALHLYHGLWSATQTLAAVHPKYDRLRRPVALGVAVVIFIGYVSIPISVLTGVLSLPG